MPHVLAVGGGGGVTQTCSVASGEIIPRVHCACALCVHLTCFDCVSYMAVEKKNSMCVCVQKGVGEDTLMPVCAFTQRHMCGVL